MNKLDEIVSAKRAEIAALKARRPLATLREETAARAARPPLAAALRAAPMGLIAEFKRRSPSAGAIREDADPADVARQYAAAGAQAISVLVDGRYFGGGEADLGAVHAAVPLPLLYKEFVVDPWQVWHAASLGAAAVLLIVAALDRKDLEALLEESGAAGMEALVEVHDEKEMQVAGQIRARFVGINNRDLKTLKTNLATTVRLARLAPEGCTLVSESGIRSAADVARVKAAGAHAVLVGEHLLKQHDLARAVKGLMADVW